MTRLPNELEPTTRRASRPRTRFLLWLFLVGAVFLLWYSYSPRLELRPPERSPAASPLALVDLEGRPVNLGDFHGKVVLLNLWATWCAPCRREIPLLVDLYRQLRGRGLVVLGLSVDQQAPGDIGRIARGWGVSYPILVPAGPLGGTFEDLGVIPHSWLIDRQGRVRASHAGILSASSLRYACLKLLDEPPAAQQ